MHLKLVQKEWLKNSRSNRWLIGNNIANRITKVSRTFPENNSETLTNEHDKEIPKGTYISPEEILVR